MRRTNRDRYALVGHPVSHSHSPMIHRLFAKQTEQDLTYELIDATDAEFEVAVLGFKAAGGKGLNITVPHKERALGLAASASDEATAAQAANTLDFQGGSIIAHNTDGIGLLRDLTTNLNLELRAKRVVVLGAGGAVRGIVCPLLDAGIANLTVANRTLSRAQKLQSVLSPHASFDICGFEDLATLDPPDIVINATSAGVHGESVPFPASLFHSEQLAYDLSYSLRETPFVKLAQRYGTGRAVQGWGMLVEQAAESFEIWRGIRPDTKPILDKIVR